MSEPTAPEVTPGGQILVVDDNRMNRIKLSHMLAQQGHTVALAENGRLALEMLGERPFDVVLLDLLMPEMDGYAVLREIKANANWRDIVVIVISALDEMESIVRCIQMGAEDYLPKPFDPVLLKARLETSLEKKKLRDLEKVYLQQEVLLRQSEKLATLGRLSAGVAHELNNPAAAVQRSASYLLTAIGRLQKAQLGLDMHGLSSAQSVQLTSLLERAAEQAAQPMHLDSLTRSDRQEEIEVWLEAQQVTDCWEYAPELVAMGYDKTALGRLEATFGKAQLSAVVAWISATYALFALAQEISQATGRISEIVKALKSYTYMDQAPTQQVNIHEGLDGTLAILRHKLKKGVEVVRDYGDNVPLIDAYGSELNQVWTNLIDNAIDAMDGQGQLTLQTRREGAWLVVAVTDNGPGIPEGIQAKIFDPFFTTKAPGQGTGLGLNISYNIVVQKHNGRFTVHSRPGETRFEVRLPLDAK
ncbi:MAG: response regulator [Anaerolineaceae bacterium]|nr:response regulator [Anaerolineaceae bacterium]